ncbi:MAG: serine/threonine-protein kinase [Planctomycetota bacterium]
MANEEHIGPYQVIEEIGRGGMGVVYKAFDPKLKRTVALKVLIAGEDASEEAIARFHHEAEAVAKLGHHPHIVPVYDIGADGNRHWFAMHYVEGKSLDRAIDDGEVTPKRAASIALQLAEALVHAHEHGILHRDVKPANVILGSPEKTQGVEIPDPKAQISTGGSERRDLPMLTDFGLAKDIRSESKMTRSGATLGTPSYMPPEQADGRLEDIDGRSDVYSLGATLYEMLTLRPPFEGNSVVEVIQKVLLREPQGPRKLNRLIEKDLETICLKCLEKDPSRRYENAKGVASDLKRFMGGRPILARPVSGFERLVRRAKRNKAATAILAVLVLVLAGGVPAGIFGLRHGRKTAEARADAETKHRDAEAGADEAAVLLEKGKRVSAVLRDADRELKAVLKTLQDSYYSLATSEEKKEAGDLVWAKVETFGKTLAPDSASQAAWLAAKGWLRHLSGDEEGALELFRRSREKDGDVLPD